MSQTTLRLSVTGAMRGAQSDPMTFEKQSDVHPRTG